MTNETENIQLHQKLIWITICIAALIIAIIAMAIIVPSTIHTNDRLAQLVDTLDENIQQMEGERYYLQSDKSTQLTRAKKLAGGWFVNKNLKEDVRELAIQYELIKQLTQIESKIAEQKFKTAYQLTQKAEVIKKSISGSKYDTYMQSLYDDIKLSSIELANYERAEKAMYELMAEKGVSKTYHDLEYDLNFPGYSIGASGILTFNMLGEYQYTVTLTTRDGATAEYGPFTDKEGKYKKISSSDTTIYGAIVSEPGLYNLGSNGQVHWNFYTDEIKEINPSQYQDYNSLSQWWQDIKEDNATNIKPSLSPKPTPSDSPANGTNVASTQSEASVSAEKRNRVSLPTNVTYTTYHNDRYGFSIDIPDFLHALQPPENGDGLKYVSDNDGVSLTVYGAYTDWLPSSTLDILYTETKDELGYVPNYTAKKDNWFVLSGNRGNTVVYEKHYLKADGLENVFIIEYPLEQEKEFDDIVTHISHSFITGTD